MLTLSAFIFVRKLRNVTFMGTISPVTNAKDCWPEAARPINVVPPMGDPTLCAVAHTMHPMSARAAEPMKKY
jgi:hypothetical protein